MFKVHPEIPESMSAEAKAFILKCFEPDPDKRDCANDLLMDEFLKVSSKKKKTQPKLSGKWLHQRGCRSESLNTKLFKMEDFSRGELICLKVSLKTGIWKLC